MTGSDRHAPLPEERSRGGWLSTFGLLLLGVVILGGLYVGTAFLVQDRTPNGLSIGGVHVGLAGEQEAREKVETELAPLTADPVRIDVAITASEQVDTAGATQSEELEEDGTATGDVAETVALELVPAEAGLGLDVDRAFADVTGFSLDPRVLWSRLVGADRDVPVHGTVDREALDTALAALAEEYAVGAQDGRISLGEDGPEVVDPVVGRRLDVETTAEKVSEAWEEQEFETVPGTASADPGRAVAGAGVLVTPELDQRALDAFTADVLDPALAEPVEVEAVRNPGDDEEKVTAELTERDLLPLLSVARDGGTLSLDVDRDGLQERLRRDLEGLEVEPQDAAVELDGDEVVVQRARGGWVLDTEELTDEVAAAVLDPDRDRAFSTELEKVAPEISTGDAERWTFEEMGSFSSAFPGGAENAARSANLEVGAGKLNGVVVPPGGTFSLGESLSPINGDNGYHEAPVIDGGRLVMGMGGGLSQLSTVVFNASWNAGVKLVAHSPHSHYISRYPAGREATLAYPHIDNVWENDTDQPIVVRSWVSGGEVHMRLLGDRQYSVETVDGPWEGVHSGQTRYDDRADCVNQAPSEGFVIVNTRILSAGGEEVSRDSFTTTYNPADQIICTNPQAPGYRG